MHSGSADLIHPTTRFDRSSLPKSVRVCVKCWNICSRSSCWWILMLNRPSVWRPSSSSRLWPPHDVEHVHELGVAGVTGRRWPRMACRRRWPSIGAEAAVPVMEVARPLLACGVGGRPTFERDSGLHGALRFTPGVAKAGVISSSSSPPMFHTCYRFLDHVLLLWRGGMARRLHHILRLARPADLALVVVKVGAALRVEVLAWLDLPLLTVYCGSTGRHWRRGPLLTVQQLGRGKLEPRLRQVLQLTESGARASLNSPSAPRGSGRCRN